VAKRGFFAELQYQNQQAAKRQAQARARAQREAQAAQRQSTKLARDRERALAQNQRATLAEQKAAEKEATRLHIEDMNAEVDARNEVLLREFEEVDGILAQALSSQAFMDLEELRAKAVHPPFNSQGVDAPIPPPTMVVASPEPQYAEPPPPKGLFGKKHHAQEIAKAQTAFDEVHAAWQEEASKVPALQLEQMRAHQQAEAQRLEKLLAIQAVYDSECEERNQIVNQANAKVDELIAKLEIHDETAIREYVSMVLGNSVYPDHFPVLHDFDFSLELKEVSLKVTLPGPSTLTDIKEYKYNKAKDEIVATNLTAKQMKDRYASAVHSVALRTLHEIFETDRFGHIQTIDLTVDTEDIDPATGKMVRIPLVAVATGRDTFSSIELNNVVPLATLQHLNAQVSNKPFGLVAIDASRGVRGH
jgi:restriction system protein